MHRRVQLSRSRRAPVDEDDSEAGPREADMRLALTDALSAGYRGYLACDT